MQYFVILLIAFALEATAANQGPERIITWQPWQEWPSSAGDRYLGDECWGTLFGFRAPTQRQENQNVDDFSGRGTGNGCCDRSRKTLRRDY